MFIMHNLREKLVIHITFVFEGDDPEHPVVYNDEDSTLWWNISRLLFSGTVHFLQLPLPPSSQADLRISDKAFSDKASTRFRDNLMIRKQTVIQIIINIIRKKKNSSVTGLIFFFTAQESRIQRFLFYFLNIHNAKSSVFFIVIVFYNFMEKGKSNVSKRPANYVPNE